MGFLSKQKKLTEDINQFTDLIPVLDYLDDEEVFILEGGYVGIGVISQPTNGVNAATQNTINGLYTIDYPKGTYIQFILSATSDINWMLQGYEQLRGKRLVGSDEAVQLSDTMSRGVQEYYEKSTTEPLNKKTGQKVRDFENWYIVKIPIANLLPTEKEMDNIRDIKEEIISKFQSIGCAPRMLTASGYIHRMNVILSQSQNALWRKGEGSIKYDDDYPVNKQVIEPASKVDFSDPSCVIIGDENYKGEHKVAKVCTFKALPDEIVYGDALGLVGDWLDGTQGLNDSFLMSLHLYLDDAKSAKAKFLKQRGYTHLGTNGKLGEKFEAAKYQREDFDRMNTEMTRENTRIVEAYMQLTIFSNSKKEARTAVKDIAGFYQSKKFILTEEKFIVGPMFLSQLPFGLDESSNLMFSRYQTYTAKTLSFLTPHIASWKGNATNTVIPLVTRIGQAFSLDLFATDGGYNCLIAATTGAGKSFFANNIIESYLGSGVVSHGTLHNDKIILPKDGGQVFAIDVGRSYEPLAAQYEGSQFIHFGSGSTFSMCPFYQLEKNALDEQAEVEYDENTGEKLEHEDKATQIVMIHNILKSMAAEDGNISNFQSSMMLHILTELVAEKGRDASITEFSERCKAHPEQQVREVGWQLTAFCEGGTYGHFFTKSKPPVDFTSSFVVCELDELKSLKHLQKIVLMTIINAAQHAMFLSGAERRKLFLLDEAWEFLKDEPGQGQNFFASFLESGWRRFRKTNAAGVCITQSLLDGYQSQAGIAIVNNSPWKLLLMQESETVDKLQEAKAYDGSPIDFKLMKSVSKVDGAFSEILVRYKQSREICRFYADRRKQLLYSTKPSDKSRINRYREQGYSFPESIDMVYNDEQNGIME